MQVSFEYTQVVFYVCSPLSKMSISLDRCWYWPLLKEAILFQYTQVSFHSCISILIDVDVGLFSQRQFSFHRSSSLLVHAGLFPQLHVCLLLSQQHISLWVPNFPKMPLLTRGQKKKGRFLLRRSLHSSCGLLESQKSCAGDPQGRTGRFRCVLFVGLYFSFSFFFPRDICKGAQSWYLVIFFQKAECTSRYIHDCIFICRCKCVFVCMYLCVLSLDLRLKSRVLPPGMTRMRFIKRTLFCVTRALYSTKWAHYSVEKNQSSVKRALYCMKRALYSIKRALYILSKRPHIVSKEANTESIECCLHQ